MSVFIGGPYGRLAIMLNKLSSLNIEIIIIIIIIIIIMLNSVHSFLRYLAKTKFLRRSSSRVVTLLQICNKQRFTIPT